SSELCVEREIWDIWSELNGENLPLPLGGMALRRSLPLTDAIECERVLTDAVRVAHANKSLLSKMLIERDLVRVDDKKLEIYLGLYANENSITMNETQLKAVQKLFDLGFSHGFYSEQICARDMLIPSEYKEIRNL
ncbi:MAG: S-ribosylhomocysteine lyase, partial [Campylobacter sp.]|nr:S-ribosylhomocysteine lyase [Campylobacter sp.]